MTAWIVVACVFAALALLSLVRVGGTVAYQADGLLVRARLGSIFVTVYPVKEKKKKEQQKKKEAPKEEKERPAQPGGSWSVFKHYLPLITDAAGRLTHKIRVDRLYLDFIAATDDPAMAAMEYGYANAAVGMVWPLFEHNFKIKERRIRTAVDFQSTRPTVSLTAAVSLRVGQAVSLGLRLAAGFLKISSRVRAEEKTQKEAA